MNENEWRDCFAMFRSITGASAEECYRFADEMLQVRAEEVQPETEGGIASVKPKKRYAKKDIV